MPSVLRWHKEVNKKFAAVLPVTGLPVLFSISAIRHAIKPAQSPRLQLFKANQHWAFYKLVAWIVLILEHRGLSPRVCSPRWPNIMCKYLINRAACTRSQCTRDGLANCPRSLDLAVSNKLHMYTTEKQFLLLSAEGTVLLGSRCAANARCVFYCSGQLVVSEVGLNNTLSCTFSSFARSQNIICTCRLCKRGHDQA